ncbi:hypothetical protein V3471_05975 [Flavobacterium oreochromis]
METRFRKLTEKEDQNMDWLIEIENNYIDSIYNLRGWEEITIAFASESVFLKGFTFDQINSPQIAKNPFVVIWEIKDGFLFKKNALLPQKKWVDIFQWQPIQTGLSITLPKLNFNFFGIQDKIIPNLVPSKEVREPLVLKVPIQLLEDYITKASLVRLQRLSWVIIEKEAFIFGEPLLPIQGQTYWITHSFVIPTGYELPHNFIVKPLQQKINPAQDNFYVLDQGSSFIKIEKGNLRPLSISSFRLTVQNGK